MIGNKMSKVATAAVVPATMLAVAFTLVLGSSSAAFTAPSEGVSAASYGGYDLTTDKPVAMFTGSGLYPGYSESHCVTVTANSDDESTLKFYAALTTNTKELAENTTITVAAGYGGTDGSQSCTGFVTEQDLYSGTASDLTTAHRLPQNGIPVAKSLAADGSQQFMITTTLSPELPNSSQGGMFDVDFGWYAHS